MNGPRNTGPEYTGKHRRDSGPGVLPPAWVRPENRARAESDARPGPGTAGRAAPTVVGLPSRRPESGFRPDAGTWADAS